MFQEYFHGSNPLHIIMIVIRVWYGNGGSDEGGGELVTMIVVPMVGVMMEVVMKRRQPVCVW